MCLCEFQYIRDVALFQSIFARLGGKTTVKRAATSTVTFDDESDDDPVGSPLEYAGVLKSSPSPVKKAKRTTTTTAVRTTTTAAPKVKKVAKRTPGMYFNL